MKKYLPFICCLLLLISSCRKDDPVVIEEPVTSEDSLREDNLLMGNPSNAVIDIGMPDNYLLVKPQFTLSYNSSTGEANWVSWHLSSSWKGSEPRCDCFESDTTLPTGLYQTSTYSYNSTGFDRGHLCPSDDRDSTAIDNATTFLMTNIIPQSPNLNRIVWASLEDYCRTLMFQGNEIYIIAGGYGSGGTGDQGYANTIGSGNINVPSDFWKVIVVVSAGSDDLNRVSDQTRVIAVRMPNTPTSSSQPWGNYRVSVDDLESLTGYNFLSAVPVVVQGLLESGVDTGPTQ